MTGTITLAIIFVVIIVAAAGFFIFIFVKDKKTKRKIRANDIQTQTISEGEYRRTLIKINAIIEKNDVEVKNFQPSIGSFSMGDLNEIAKELISQIIQDNHYRTYIKNQEEFSQFNKNLNSLYRAKASSWDKTSREITDFFRSKLKDEMKNMTPDLGAYNISYKKEVQDFYDINISKNK